VIGQRQCGAGRGAHPFQDPREFAGSDIVGHALARWRERDRDIHVLGRRGPHQIAMTPKELGELAHLEDAAPRVEASDFRPSSTTPCSSRAAQVGDLAARLPGAGAGSKRKTIHFDFFASRCGSRAKARSSG
jgi:ferredoxin--NADP+ reductase